MGGRWTSIWRFGNWRRALGYYGDGNRIKAREFSVEGTYRWTSRLEETNLMSLCSGYSQEILYILLLVGLPRRLLDHGRGFVNAR